MRLSDLWRPIRAEVKYLLWLPLYLLSFLILERLPISGYWATQTPWDQAIPFCEWFVIPYCLWYPLLVAVGLFLLARNREGFRRYMVFLALTFFLSEVIWFLIPNGQDLRPLVMPRDNFLTRWVAGLYAIDTNTNVFPSVHVVGSIGAAWAVWDCRCLHPHRVLRWAVAVLAVLICLSTLFIKQHACLDVLSGLVLSLAVGLLVYHRSLVRAFRPLIVSD